MKLAQITKGAGGRIPRRRNIAVDQEDLEKQFQQFQKDYYTGETQQLHFS